jgi:hypothetical protein
VLPPRLRSLLAALAGFTALASSGCGAASAISPTAPQAPNDGLTRCTIARGQDNPLVTEWTASEKASLETQLQRGAVVVAYHGCEMRILSDCPVRGVYAWKRTTTSTDVIDIHDADELYSKLPLGAVKLEGELQRSGRLSVQTTVAGQLVLQGWEVADVANNPACVGATHVIGQLSIGTFKLKSGGAVRVGGGVSVPVIGGGASTSSEQAVVREAGDADKCKLASDQAPHPECASPIQVFLQPLPAQLVDRGPPGTVKVNFVAAEGGEKWSVQVGDRKVCETPCERWVDPVMPYTMRSEAGFMQKDNVADVPDLREQRGNGPFQVRAHPRSTAGLVGGITATTFGGLGLAAGVVFLAVGCSSDDRKGMCTAGKVTLPLGGLVTAGGIYLIVTSGERAEVLHGSASPRLGVGASF